MNFTAQDPHAVSEIATRIGWQLMFSFVRITAFTLIYGIFVLLFLHSVRVYCSRKQPKKSQHWMFVVTTITFALTTINEAAFILEISLLISSAFVEDQYSNPLIRYHRAIGLVTKSSTACAWINAFQSFISDGIIVWRAYILLPHKWWLIALPLFMLLCSIALMLPFLLSLAMGATIVSSNTLGLTSIGLSLTTNVMATALIGNVYWKEMLLGLGAHRTTQAERVLALITESGVIFCMLQSTTLILTYIPTPELGTPRFYLYAIIGSVFYGLTAMYPTAVIALVNSHRTFDQMCSINTFPRSGSPGMDRHSAVTLQDIAFAHPPMATVDTAENRE